MGPAAIHGPNDGGQGAGVLRGNRLGDLRRVDLDAMTAAIIAVEGYPRGSDRTVQDP